MTESRPLWGKKGRWSSRIAVAIWRSPSWSLSTSCRRRRRPPRSFERATCPRSIPPVWWSLREAQEANPTSNHPPILLLLLLVLFVSLLLLSAAPERDLTLKKMIWSSRFFLIASQSEMPFSETFSQTEIERESEREERREEKEGFLRFLRGLVWLRRVEKRKRERG